MQRGKQWRPTSQIFFKDPSPHRLRQGSSHPPLSPTLTLASHQLYSYRDRQKRERRESERRTVDGCYDIVLYNTVQYSPVQHCTTTLYNLSVSLLPLPTGVEDKRWKFQRMNFHANLASKSSNINFTETQMLLEALLAKQSGQD